MLRSPVLLKIIRRNEDFGFVDIFPVYRQEAEFYVATDTFRMYEAFPGEDAADPEGRIRRYLEHLGAGGPNADGYLGELRFPGDTLFEWAYHGVQLVEEEVMQVINFLQSRQATFVPGSQPVTALVFSYDRAAVRSKIRLVDNAGAFLVFINGRYTAAITSDHNHWRVFGGRLTDVDMRNAIIRRIRSYTAKS